MNRLERSLRRGTVLGPTLPTTKETMTSTQLAVLLALVGASSTVYAVSVTTQNKCDKPMQYKIEGKGSTLNTSLSQRASTSHSLSNGDRIKVGNLVVHTVSASSAGQTVVICAK
jgi:hypothetical protein